jgi:hypothetical protein
VGLGLYALFTAAEFTGFGPVGLGANRVPVSIALSLGPLALYLALKHPLLFPFGAYIFTLPLEPILMHSGSATTTRLVAILSGGVLFLHILARRELRHPGTAWFGWLAVTTWGACSFAWSIDAPATTFMFGMVVQLFLLTTILAVYPASRADLMKVMAIAVASGVFAACYGLYGYYSGRVFGFGASRLTLVNDSGLQVDPNGFATGFILPIALALAALSTSRKATVRIGAGLALVLMIVGVLLSSSRGGFISTSLVLAYYMIRGRQRLATLAIGAAGLGLSLLFPSVWTRFATDDGGQGSGTGRTFIWATGLLNFKDHFLAGSGLGTYHIVYDRNFLSVYQKVFEGWSRPGHSLIVTSLVEMGVVGLAVVLGAWFLTFRQLRGVGQSSSLYPLRIALEAALVGLFYESLTIDTLYLKYYWLVFAFVLMVAAAARKEATEAPVQAHGGGEL